MTMLTTTGSRWATTSEPTGGAGHSFRGVNRVCHVSADSLDLPERRERINGEVIYEANLPRRPNPRPAMIRRVTLSAALALSVFALSSGQEKSVKPGINDPFKDPDVKDFLTKFEGESREIFTQRKA